MNATETNPTLTPLATLLCEIDCEDKQLESSAKAEHAALVAVANKLTAAKSTLQMMRTCSNMKPEPLAEVEEVFQALANLAAVRGYN